MVGTRYRAPKVPLRTRYDSIRRSQNEKSTKSAQFGTQNTTKSDIKYMFYTLAKTDPALSGKFGLSIDYKEHTIANLVSLNTKATIHNIPVKLYNGEYEFDIRRCYRHYYDGFYDQPDDSDKICQFGMSRVSKKLFNRQFMFYAPFYCDNVDDMPDSFVIDIYRKDRILSSVSVPLGDNTYIGKYLRSYIKKIDDNVVTISKSDLKLLYYGIDLINGGLVEYEHNNLVFDHAGNPNITHGFNDKKIVVRQIIPLCITFDLNKYIGQDIVVQGYYIKNKSKLPLYDLGDKIEFKNILSNDASPYILNLKDISKNYTSPLTKVSFLESNSKWFDNVITNFINYIKVDNYKANADAVVKTYSWSKKQEYDAVVRNGSAMYNNVVFSGLGDAKKFRIEINPIINNLNRENVVSSQFVIDHITDRSKRIDVNFTNGENTFNVHSDNKDQGIDFDGFFELVDNKELQQLDKSSLYIQYNQYTNKYVKRSYITEQSSDVKNVTLGGEYEYTGITVTENSNYNKQGLYVCIDGNYIEYNHKIHSGRLYKKSEFVDITQLKGFNIESVPFTELYTYVPIDQHNSAGYFTKTSSLYKDLYILNVLPHGYIPDLDSTTNKTKLVYCALDGVKYKKEDFEGLLKYKLTSIYGTYNVNNNGPFVYLTSDGKEIKGVQYYKFCQVPVIKVNEILYNKLIKLDDTRKPMLYLCAEDDLKPQSYDANKTQFGATKDVIIRPVFGRFRKYKDNDTLLYDIVRSKCDLIDSSLPSLNTPSNTSSAQTEENEGIPVLKTHNKDCMIRYDLLSASLDPKKLKEVLGKNVKYYKKIVSGTRNHYITHEINKDTFIYKLNINITSDKRDWRFEDLNTDVLDIKEIKSNIHKVLSLLKDDINQRVVKQPTLFEHPYKNKFYAGDYIPLIQRVKKTEKLNVFYVKTTAKENKHYQYNKVVPLRDNITIKIDHRTDGTRPWDSLLDYYNLKDEYKELLMRVYDYVILPDKIEYTLI